MLLLRLLVLLLLVLDGLLVLRLRVLRRRRRRGHGHEELHPGPDALRNDDLRGTKIHWCLREDAPGSRTDEDGHLLVRVGRADGDVRARIGALGRDDRERLLLVLRGRRRRRAELLLGLLVVRRRRLVVLGHGRRRGRRRAVPAGGIVRGGGSRRTPRRGRGSRSSLCETRDFETPPRYGAAVCTYCCAAGAGAW